MQQDILASAFHWSDFGVQLSEGMNDNILSSNPMSHVGRFCTFLRIPKKKRILIVVTVFNSVVERGSVTQ